VPILWSALAFSLSLVLCRFALKVPDNLPLVASAPLLCAGITMYSPMKHYGLDKPGMKIGVVGLGGLGHMAVKFGKVRSLHTTIQPPVKESSIYLHVKVPCILPIM
jgi:D-arabinose 1-dehydrogenase-like Zn-dependent alcohol dehydrogenase